MGGSALLIHGRLDPAATAPRRGWWSRLLGRPSTREFASGAGRTMLEHAAGDLGGLARGFEDWLRRELVAPWPASKAVLDYLALDVATVYLRGEREDGGPAKTYAQLSFSGCGGMAQTSSELAAHWARLWFERERPRIETMWLAPRGFAAAEVEVVAESELFLPAGDTGYAQYSVAPLDVGDGGPPRHFVVDDALAETDEAATGALLAVLERDHAATMADGRCRCQLCMPSFDPASVAGLPAFA